MERRRFLQWLLAAPVALLGLAGCGSDASETYPIGGGMAACDGAQPTAMDLHTHPLCIPQSLLSSPVDSTLTLQDGGFGHTHTIFLSAADLTAIANSTNSSNLVRTSSVTAHSHQVTFRV